MKLHRSLLFVPGHRAPTWGPKAVASGADALIFDLEDSVPIEAKAEARAAVAATVAALKLDRPELGMYARLNSLESYLPGEDLAVTAGSGLHGFVLPKTYTRDDVVRFDALVTDAEWRAGMPIGQLEFILALETAQAYANCEQMVAASPRVATLFAGTARDADVARSIGFQFTPEGAETLFLRSKALLATRAAGLPFPLIGLWQDIHDLDGCRRFAQDNRRLGFRGQVLIHPSHVTVANEVFTPAPEDIVFYQGMVDAFEAAERAGVAAIDYEGQHIDYAHVRTAREIIEQSRQLAAASVRVGTP